MIDRRAKSTLERLTKSFPVVLVTGSRQTGKTTLLKNYIPYESYNYLTFDKVQNVNMAKNDAQLFMSMYQPPVVFDEIQYVPELFSELKILVDSNRKNGMFFLTGSQQFSMMKNVSESLAGRIGILKLLPISLRELNCDTKTNSFIPTKDFLLKRNNCINLENKQPLDIWKIIQRGMYPELCATEILQSDFYSSYISTYIERDVRLLTQVGDELQFLQFICVVASRTGQLVNYADIARTVGIDSTTAKRWLSILVTSGLVYLLQPYYGNIEKKIVKTPKLYFIDTGLAAHLTKWTNPEVLSNGAMAGAFFETFVVSEILKSFTNEGIEPPLYFYRDSSGIEIDLLIENDGILYPVEIKSSCSVHKKDYKNFAYLTSIKDKKIEKPLIINNSKQIEFFENGEFSLPVWWI